MSFPTQTTCLVDPLAWYKLSLSSSRSHHLILPWCAFTECLSQSLPHQMLGTQTAFKTVNVQMGLGPSQALDNPYTQTHTHAAPLNTRSHVQESTNAQACTKTNIAAHTLKRTLL